MPVRRNHCNAWVKRVLFATAASGLFAGQVMAAAPRHTFDIPAQDAASALRDFAKQSGRQVLFPYESVAGRTAPAVRGDLADNDVLARLAESAGLMVTANDGDVVTLRAAAPQDGSAGGGAETNVVQELVVTAQKKEEAIQTVPIAISAFTQKTLEAQHIEGGFDLLKAIPNVTFSKNNFTSYNFSIRGIGTKAISVTTDPGVAVEFNSSALIRNRLFEQEYFDIERVEVMRGPQGTLHGRNATAGVINVISAKPTDHFEGSLKAEVGNYQSRRASGFINVPIFGDKLAVRVAGSFTDREGYDYNATTQHRINGRNLWSGRVTVGFHPTERIHADLIWEHFDEDDDRSRTGKQLCKHDPGPLEVSAPGYPTYFFENKPGLARSWLSQGCLPNSLYDKDSFQTPNGLSIPFVLAAADSGFSYVGLDAAGNSLTMIKLDTDPYGGMLQSPDLRVINSIRDPRYQAQTDVFELNASFDITPALSLTSQTAYVRDKIYSFQDYNRFNTVPAFQDTSLIASPPFGWDGIRKLAPGGVFCDPQIGCSSSIAGFDISRAKSEQFSQEFRLSSNFNGSINFGAGVNYTHYKTLEDYFVMNNLITMLAEAAFFTSNHTTDPTICAPNNGTDPMPMGSPGTETCLYIDPNPLESMDGEGHNYFRSKNPYRLNAYGTFGEVYWQATDALKFTVGLRYNDDNKVFTPIPSQTLLSSNLALLGTVNKGYPALPDIKQHWGKFSGRAVVDWKPDLSFTDQTLVYASYSRGYKAGGANPPGIGFRPDVNGVLPYPATFDPEFVNAFEVGAKNTLLGGALIFNGDAYFYDYKDYQVSQIKERTAVNENFDATAWGLEFESMFQPSRNLRINATLGYQDTSIADGERSIDLMNRTQGDQTLLLSRPIVPFASSCVVPKTAWLSYGGGLGVLVCGNGMFGIFPLNWLGGPNDGMGVYAKLGGKELPNAPHWTTSWGAQYSVDLLGGEWRATMRGDAYWQSQSWARVYNAVNDKLHGWYNLNFSLWIEKPEAGLKIELYVKNALDKTPITDAFLNSDDSGLTTNVFVLDPRLIGFSVTKKF